jgi:hypothetical protein
MQFAAEIRKDSHDIWIFRIGISIEEAIEFFAVTM